MRLSNGEAPSLIESICRAKGLDYRDLKDNPYKVNNNSITNLMILDEVDEIGRNIIRKFHSLDYKLESIKEIIEEYFHTKDNKKTEDIYKKKHLNLYQRL